MSCGLKVKETKYATEKKCTESCSSESSKKKNPIGPVMSCVLNPCPAGVKSHRPLPPV